MENQKEKRIQKLLTLIPNVPAEILSGVDSKSWNKPKSG